MTRQELMRGCTRRGSPLFPARWVIHLRVVPLKGRHHRLPHLGHRPETGRTTGHGRPQLPRQPRSDRAVPQTHRRQHAAGLEGSRAARLAAGFEIGVATAWRYVQEAIALLSAATDDLDTAMRRIRLLAYAILDGTLISIDRVAEQRPYDSGKHKRHGVNVQVIADAAGRLVWASPALPGATHDLTAARHHGIIDALTSADVTTFADKGYQGAHGSVRTPFTRRRFRPKLSRRQKAVNRAHAKIRAREERAITTLKT